MIAGFCNENVDIMFKTFAGQFFLTVLLIKGGKLWNGGKGLWGCCEDARSHDGQACSFQVITIKQTKKQANKKQTNKTEKQNKNKQTNKQNEQTNKQNEGANKQTKRRSKQINNQINPTPSHKFLISFFRLTFVSKLHHIYWRASHGEKEGKEKKMTETQRAMLEANSPLFRNIFIGPRSPLSDLTQTMWVSETPCWNLTDVTLADKDTNSMLTNYANRTIQDNFWNLNVMSPSGGQICNLFK